MTALDWLDIPKLIDDAIARNRYGRGHKIEWAKSSPWRGVDVERILNAYGIRAYCRDYGHGKNTLGLHVPTEQAEWADWVLRRDGVPLIGAPLSNVAKGAPAKKWGTGVRPVGLAGMFVGRQRQRPRQRPQRRQQDDGFLDAVTKLFR